MFARKLTKHCEQVQRCVFPPVIHPDSTTVGCGHSDFAGLVWIIDPTTDQLGKSQCFTLAYASLNREWGHFFAPEKCCELHSHPSPKSGDLGKFVTQNRETDCEDSLRMRYLRTRLIRVLRSRSVAKKIDRNFYVSWIAEANDPWPGWKFPSNKGGSSSIRSEDDGEWPGIPEQKIGETTVALPGPTLSALFHPRSRFYNLGNLDKVYLLYQLDIGSSQELFSKVISRIIKARNSGGANIDEDKVVYVPIQGITNPTDHERIIECIEGWIHSKDDPFRSRKPPKADEDPARITINLSPGTPAMHASWMLMYWKGAFRQPPGTTVTFIQGDGGRRENDGVDETTRQPIRDVPFGRLTNLIDLREERHRTNEIPSQYLTLDQLSNIRYQELSRNIDQAALLGIPIVLIGERGTGKTMLANHYHERRLFYQQHTAAAQIDRGSKPLSINDRFQSSNSLVSITLSEFSNVEELRDQLFGWAKGSFTGATEDYPGLLGQADGGTLFLDEIHHLASPLQAAMLRPMNDGKYRPKGAKADMTSHFNLVVATNDDKWSEKMAEDFRDRIERIVLRLPSFAELRKTDPTCEDLLRFWDHTIRRRCHQAGVHYQSPPDDCQSTIRNTLEHKDLKGNWRDLHRMADHVLLDLVHARGGRITPIQWEVTALRNAIARTFDK